MERSEIRGLQECGLPGADQTMRAMTRVRSYPSPFSGRVDCAKAQSGWGKARRENTPPGRSQVLASTLPLRGRD